MDIELGILLFLGISLLLLIFAYVSFRQGAEYRRTAARQNRETQDFLSRAVRVPALVVNIEERTETLTLGKYPNKYRDFLPVVQFRTWQGQPVQTRAEVGVERNPPQVGQQVEVCYDAAQPQRARLGGPGLYPPRINRRGFSGSLSLVYGGLCLVTGIGGTIGSIVALLV